MLGSKHVKTMRDKLDKCEKAIEAFEKKLALFGDMKMFEDLNWYEESMPERNAASRALGAADDARLALRKYLRSFSSGKLAARIKMKLFKGRYDKLNTKLDNLEKQLNILRSLFGNVEDLQALMK